MTLKSPYLNSEIISNSKSELQKIGRTGEIARRLNAIISSYNHSISDVARIYNTTNKTVRWHLPQKLCLNSNFVWWFLEKIIKDFFWLFIAKKSFIISINH